jgi:hypothetical protein
MDLVDPKIVSGGQTGADRAALDWAIEHGMPHGGWCPKGRKAEDGTIPARYAMQETPDDNPVQRTEWNVRDSDGTVIFSIKPRLTGGSKTTEELVHRHGKPVLHLCQGAQREAPELALRRFIREHRIRVLNVAGPRASEEPGVAEFVRKVLDRTFEIETPGSP